MAFALASYTKKLIVVLIILILVQNVCCLENVESEQGEKTENMQSQVDSNSNEVNNDASFDDQPITEEIQNEEITTDLETDQEESQSITIDDVSTDDGMTLIKSKIENENNYFDNRLFIGSFVYTYPIETAKGINNLEPKVTLTYTSIDGTEGTYSSLGRGWSLNNYCILRDTRYTPENTSDDKYILILDGSSYNLNYVEDDGAYHTETETFMKVTKETTNTNNLGEYWLLIMPDGTKHRFGYTVNSEQLNSVQTRNYVSKWWLDLIEDVNGNQIQYNYMENTLNGEIGTTYLDNITYNNGISSIDFEYGDKSNSFTLFQYGNKICEKSILSNINVINNETFLWKYEIQYVNEDSKLYLENITKIGANNQKYPSTTFEYDSITGWEQNDSWIPPVTLSANDGRLEDVNGDGLVDIVKGYMGDHGYTSYCAWINNGHGWIEDDSWNPPTYFQLNDQAVGAIVDVNGDGLVDIIQNGGSYSSAPRSAWINKGYYWSQCIPVNGDWDGNGYDEPGGYNTELDWVLWNTTANSSDSLVFGISGAEPVVGDWDGDGADEVGVYNRDGNNFLLKTDSGINIIGLGWTGVTPVVGDWNGDGADEVGVYNNEGTWALWNTNNNSADIVGFGWIGTEPVVGDWDGDGTDEVGVYNRDGNNFLLKTDSGINIIGLGWTGVTPVMGDWNGDGADEVGVYNNEGTWALWNTDNNSADIVGFGSSNTSPVVGDWDGNSDTEIGTYDAVNHAFLLQINTGVLINIGSEINTPWKQNDSWIPPLVLSAKGVRLADVNGDGLVDIVRGYMNGDYTNYSAWINNGHGWIEDNSWNPPTFLHLDDSAVGCLVDVNGDGLVDIIQNGSLNSRSAWMNTGDGWEQNDSWIPPLVLSVKGVRLADVNGDGLVDIVRGYMNGDYTSYHAWINNGQGWVEDNSWNPPTYFDITGETVGVIVDVNGDGLVDIVQNRFNSESAWINTNNDLNTEGYKTPGLLKEIKHSNGAITTLKFMPSTKFDNEGFDGVSDMPFNVWVLTQLTEDNGVSGSEGLISVTDYTYKDGMQFFNPPEEIGFRGFGEVTVENNYSIEKHIFHQDEVLKGIEYHTELWNKDGDIYSSYDREYSTQQLYDRINLVLLNSEKEFQFDGSIKDLDYSAGWSHLTEYTDYDNYGNPLSVTEYGDVDIQGDERYHQYEYANDLSTWILGKKTHERLQNSSGSNVRESWYYYDNSDNSHLNKGLLTTEVSWNNVGENPVVSYEYDNCGNIIEITNARGYSQSLEYDENKLYPTSIENALGQKTHYKYNDLGLITKITDSNGISTEYIYDDLHRVTKVLKPNDTPDNPSTEYVYYQDGVAPEWILTRTKQNAIMEGNSNGIDSSDFSNSKIITISPSADGTLTDYQMSFDIEYEPEMQSDFDDLRFTDDNGVLLPYWIEEKIDSTSAKVWVKVPEISGVDDTTIKMYYGNLTIASTSNGDDVFDFFDDFNDLSKWYQYGSTPLNPSENTVSEGILTTAMQRGLNQVRHLRTATELPITDDFVIDTRMNVSTETAYHEERLFIMPKESSNVSVTYGKMCVYASNDKLYYNYQNDQYVGFTINIDTWYKCSVSYSGGNGTISLFTDTGTLLNSVSGSIPDNGNYLALSCSHMYGQYDYILVRKYASSEPAYSILNTVDSSDFSNNKIITISPSADGTLTDYQMSFDIDYEPEMQSDFDDLRFTDDNGALLPYWIEEKIDSTSAKVWVKVPEISGVDDTTIKMYYGNLTIASTSNGDDVFDFFDDFNDLSKWYQYGSTPLSPSQNTVSDGILTTAMQRGLNQVRHLRTATELPITDDFVIDTRMNVLTETAYHEQRLFVMPKENSNTPDTSGKMCVYASKDKLYYNYQSNQYVNLTINDNIWYKCSISYSGGNGTISLFTDTGTLLNSVSGSIPDNGNYLTLSCSHMYGKYDYILVHKYASSKPTYTMSKASTEIDLSPYVFDSISTYDGFGQLIQKQYEGEDDWIIQKTAYNELGLVENAEIPHYINQSGLSVTYEYDTIGRPKVITNTDGTTLTYHYKLENTTITNQNGINKTLTSDVFGNVVKVYEFNGNETYITSYGYDALNNFIEIQPGLNQPQVPPNVQFTYDSLGRKTAMSDPDMGNWSYNYDLNGNLISQTDARGVSTSLTYDALDRVTAINYPNDADVSFTYDLEFNGTLSQVTKGAFSSSYDYDQRYRIEDETVALDGTPYTTSYEYDSMDRVTKITCPDGGAVDLTYNAQTLLESVEGVIDSIDYNARNQIMSKEYSNGVITTYAYDPAKLLLNRVHTEGLLDLNYDFDNVGNILEIQDNVRNSVKTYGYDDLDRLTSADMSVSSVPTYQRDFTYDQYGCIRQVDENSAVISAYGYSLAPFHAPVTYNGNDLDYDDNGNLIEDEDFIYTYNNANQLSEVRYSGNNSLVEKYWYDANGKRIKKQNSDSEFTYYVNKFYEVDDGIATSYFFRDDERVAKETAGDMEWYLSDHIGSTSLMVDENGLEVERTDYFPYGQIQSGGTEKYGFTGQESDADTELMYYGARYYSPAYRVFVQPDTLLPDPYNPQALNRYAYALDNPVKYTDPSGHIVIPAIAIAGVKAVSTVIDYGWNVYDLATDSWTVIDPNSNAFDKEVAIRCLALNIVSESLDPDEFLPVNTPADDIARKALKNEIRKEVKEELLETAAKNAGKTGFINPDKVRYTQDSIKFSFSDKSYGDVDDLIEGLKNGNVNPSDVPSIQIFEMNGNLYSLDNRRLYAFKEAGIEVPYEYASPERITDEWKKLTTKNNGANVRIRGGGE